MANIARFPYTTLVDPMGMRLIRPILSISLAYNRRVTSDALIDTGSDVNVLPLQLGLDLGLNWDNARPVPSLSGNLRQAEARAIILQAQVHSFAPTQMVFIWVKADDAHLLLGQINFFQEFNVCLFGADEYFEISPK